MGARYSILRAALGERLRYDLGPLKEPVARLLYAGASALTRTSSEARQAKGFNLLMRLHTSAMSPWVDRRIIALLEQSTSHERQGRSTGLWACYASVVREAVEAFAQSAGADPLRYLGTRILVVKSARPGERGVIVVDYSNIFPLLAGYFDLKKISERYTLVLEPSWAGICAPDVLLFSRLSQPVYVQSLEPRDHHLLSAIKTNLIGLPIAANWWVDPRSAPPPDTPRDIDVIMVASWADLKCHWRFFRALSQLRKRGHRLKVVLVGYEFGRTRRDIEEQADYFGVGDQIETYERISQDDVWNLLVRSKIHVLWSRREASNRAIVEAMMADVPIIVREGLNFGHHYPHVNRQTGRFVKDGELGDAMLDMIANRHQYSPREWVVQNMTCHTATQVVERALQGAAVAAGEPWSEGLVVKISALDAQHYLNASDDDRFRDDYAFLESTVVKNAAIENRF